ncbi:MAG: type I methionyl aminopeptidase [Patescibacteria group bacterium]
MAKIKTPQQIKTMREGGKILAKVLDLVIKKVKPGITTGELNKYAEDLIKGYGATASFKNYKASWADDPYPAALCVSVNNEVVHGLPDDDRKLKNGDIVGLDCGLKYKGLYTDMAKTVVVGGVSKGIKKLLTVTEESLYKGIRQAKVGNRISDISRAVQDHVEKNGFSVVRQLCGHGVGLSAHEDPQIPNYVEKNLPDIKLAAGMTLAIEPMVNAGDYLVETLDDGWTVVTADGKLSAHFEHTIVVTEKGGEIITK